MKYCPSKSVHVHKTENQGRFKIYLNHNTNVWYTNGVINGNLVQTNIYSFRNALFFINKFLQCYGMKMIDNYNLSFSKRLIDRHYVIYDWSAKQNMYVLIRNVNMMRNAIVIMQIMMKCAKKVKMNDSLG